MRKIAVSAVAAASALALAGGALAAGWQSNVSVANAVASTPVLGGGYPVPAGSSAPVAGTCRLGSYDSNRSESWLAVKPGTEDLVGASKFFFERFSTFYDFHLGAYTIPAGKPAGNAQIPGYDCISTGTQAMPPNWTNDTDPNVDFDTRGRAYQVTLPFNAYWANFHPNGAIGVVTSDDLGRTWTTANGGEFVEFLNKQSSFAAGGYEDKQWVAVNQASLSPFRDHVYAMWSIFDGNTAKLRLSVSADRGATFSAPVTITEPSQTGPATTYVYPAVDAGGTLYVALASFPRFSGAVDADVYVTRSTDDGRTFAPWSFVARARGNPGTFANGNFRDGILEAFAASKTYPGHLYVTYEDWGGAQMDVRLSESIDGGITWRDRRAVADAANAATTDQFQPEVATGPDGGMAVAFYDRRSPCPNDASVKPSNIGAANTCIDVSAQAYRETGASTYASPVGSNVRLTQFAWDPAQPAQTVGGIGQIACSGHDDPCSEVFIGDYFGLALSQRNLYGLFVSTHYPSSVPADGGGRVFYQQQVLATASRKALGIAP